MRALLALAVATATLATALPGASEEEEDRRVQALFHRWVREYRPPYADRRTAAERREWSHRLGVFRTNLRSFEEHNSNHAERTGITQGVTPFADQTEEENRLMVAMAALLFCSPNQPYRPSTHFH